MLLRNCDRQVGAVVALVPLLVLLLVAVGSRASPQDVLILETENVRDVNDPEKRANYYDPRVGPISSCAPFQTCLPLSQCLDAHYELARVCLLTGDRSAVCGYTDGAEPLICCNRRLYDGAENLQQQFGGGGAPQFVGIAPPMNGLNGPGCGRPLVQSQLYRGLGAFPFVARVGFKSEDEFSEV